jgi:ribonuclease I
MLLDPYGHRRTGVRTMGAQMRIDQPKNVYVHGLLPGKEYEIRVRGNNGSLKVKCKFYNHVRCVPSHTSD